MNLSTSKRIASKQNILDVLNKVATCLKDPQDNGEPIEKLGEFISIRLLHQKLTQSIQDIDTNLVDRSYSILEMAGKATTNHKSTARFSASLLPEINHRLRPEIVEHLNRFDKQVISTSPFKTMSDGSIPMEISIKMLDDVDYHTTHIIQSIVEVPYFPSYKLVIIIYNENGEKLDTYHLNQCHLSSVEHNALDVNGSDPITKTLHFLYDNVSHTKWRG